MPSGLRKWVKRYDWWKKKTSLTIQLQIRDLRFEYQSDKHIRDTNFAITLHTKLLDHQQTQRPWENWTYFLPSLWILVIQHYWIRPDGVTEKVNSRKILHKVPVMQSFDAAEVHKGSVGGCTVYETMKPRNSLCNHIRIIVLMIGVLHRPSKMSVVFYMSKHEQNGSHLQTTISATFSWIKVSTSLIRVKLT